MKLLTYCKDIDRWPQSWAGFPDLVVLVEERIVAGFVPFLLALIRGVANTENDREECRLSLTHV